MGKMNGEISLVNRAIYYWDYYLLTGEIDYLVSSHTFMKSYRESGGDMYTETEKSINAMLETRLKEAK